MLVVTSRCLCVGVYASVCLRLRVSMCLCMRWYVCVFACILLSGYVCDTAWRCQALLGAVCNVVLGQALPTVVCRCLALSRALSIGAVQLCLASKIIQRLQRSAQMAGEEAPKRLQTSLGEALENRDACRTRTTAIFQSEPSSPQLSRTPPLERPSGSQRSTRASPDLFRETLGHRDVRHTCTTARFQSEPCSPPKTPTGVPKW